MNMVSIYFELLIKKNLDLAQEINVAFQIIDHSNS